MTASLASKNLVLVSSIDHQSDGFMSSSKIYDEQAPEPERVPFPLFVSASWLASCVLWPSVSSSANHTERLSRSDREQLRFEEEAEEELWSSNDTFLFITDPVVANFAKSRGW